MDNDLQSNSLRRELDSAARRADGASDKILTTVTLGAVRYALGVVSRGESPCTWSCEEEGVYATSCGERHLFVDGGPADNNHRFCAYCGGTITERYHT